MANPLTFAIGLILAAAIGIQLASAWKYLKARERGKAEHIYEKDVEWQLQHELADAIEASSKASTPPLDESQHLMSLNSVTRIRYDDPPPPPPGSHVDLRWQYSRDRLEEVEREQRQFDLLERTKAANGLQTRSMDRTRSAVLSDLVETDHPSLGDESAAFVNPKQFQRILKRRLTRQWMEKYFDARRAKQTRGPRVRVAGH